MSQPRLVPPHTRLVLPRPRLVLPHTRLVLPRPRLVLPRLRLVLPRPRLGPLRGAPSSCCPRKVMTNASLEPALTVPSNTTKATLWIESRKSSPRRAQSTAQATPPARRALSAKKATPLRLAVLRKAQSAHKQRVVKIEAPSTIDHTKQAAIMLMTGHTAKARLSLGPSPRGSPSFLVKRPSPVHQTVARKGCSSARRSTGHNLQGSTRTSGNQSVTILEVTDSDTQPTMRCSRIGTRSSRSPLKSHTLPSPRKSALKDHSKKGARKTESIKFDLSNLEDSETTSRFDSEGSMSEDNLTLHYSESSNQSPSPSPRKSVSNRSSRMLEILGTTMTISPSKTLTPKSPLRKSMRGSLMVQQALNDSPDNSKIDTTVASAFRTRTFSPRYNIESYSVVDLVSFDSDATRSMYDSANSTDATFKTPNASKRTTRSTIEPTLLGSSTPYIPLARPSRSRSSPNVTNVTNKSSRASAPTRRSKSLTTPENQHTSVISARVSRASRSRSRINDSDLQLLEDTDVDDSPKTSRRTRTKSVNATRGDESATGAGGDGMCTPEDRHSPVDVGTPVLSIQSLLDSSRSSIAGDSPYRALSESKRRPANKSLGVSARQTVLRLSEDSNKTDEGSPRTGDGDTITPKSAVKLVQEAVKKQHSTAKKPQSKRSIIDDLNQSDIVKQLFNSPVKRKLSQSMKEFSRKHIFDDEEILPRRPTRHTLAAPGTNRSPSDRSPVITLERLVSPINNSPDLRGIKRLLDKNTPKNDSRNVSNVGSLTRTQRIRKSTKNDLTDVAGLKRLFAKSPRNSLSDVRVKEVFKSGPKNDLRRVSGVKSLFHRSPNNDLSDVRGVKKLFRRSPNNDLRNVSGVKRTLRKSPRNDLTDVRGVGNLFRPTKKKESLHDVSGIEELFDSSSQSTSENLFDQLVGKAKVRSVYSNTFSSKMIQRRNTRHQNTFHESLDTITRNPEGWLQAELQKRLQNKASNDRTKELSKLMTSTVEGEQPIRTSRTRNSSMMKKSASDIYSAHTLPIKKRSVDKRSIAERSADKRSLSLRVREPPLPIKKRAVIHSTPVKGRQHAIMNASELGRVSPIAPIDRTTTDHDTSLTRSTRRNVILEVSTGQKSKAKTPQKRELTPKKSTPTTKATPKKSQVSPQPKTPEQSPKKVETTLPLKRSTRNRKNTTTENIKKKRSSLVISKKAPVMSPKAGSEDKSQAGKASPKVRTTTEETTRRTLRRAQRVTAVVPKPKPRTTGTAPKTRKASDIVPTRGRKAPADVPEASPPVKRRRGKHNVSHGKENRSDNVDKPKRGRKALNDLEATTSSSPAPKRRRGERNEVETTASEKKQPKSRSKKVQTQESIQSEPSTRRGRKATETVAVQTTEKKQPKPRGKKAQTQGSVQSEPPTRRGRKATEIVAVETTEKKQPNLRDKNVQTKGSVQSEPLTRRGRKQATEIVAVETTEKRQPILSGKNVQTKANERSVRSEPPTRRGRKGTVTVAVETTDKKQPVDKARSQKAENQESVQSEPTRRGRRAKAPEPEQPKSRGQKAAAIETETRTRGKKGKTLSSVQTEPVTRGRRAKATETVIPETKSRKRKSTAKDEVPAKVAKMTTTRGKKAESEVKAAQTKGGATTIGGKEEVPQSNIRGNARGKATEVEEKPQGPSRATRGKKAAEPRSPVTKRKRTANASPTKGSSAVDGRRRRR